MCSETHLTKHGATRFKKGLVALKSPFTHFVPGHPCNARTQSDAGEYTGVCVLSRYPARALPHEFDLDCFQTSRIQIAGVAIRNNWIQLGVLYGYPDSSQHVQRTYRTNCLLAQLIDRVACQACGPRAIGGDFNHDSSSLEQLDRLRAMGFKEVQSIANEKWGVPFTPTGKGAYCIDQLWLSPELQSLLVSVAVVRDHWSDHASVIANFTHSTGPLYQWKWNMPRAFPWPEQWKCQVQVDWLNPSVAYAEVWSQLESQAKIQGARAHHRACGRGLTLDTVPELPRHSPCKLGRHNDIQPTYFGASLQHAQWFRQLRRIQALQRMSHCQAPQLANRFKTIEVWKAIRNAAGFQGGFCKWWNQHYSRQIRISLELPLPPDVVLIFELFRKAVADLEMQLKKSRTVSAKARRVSDANLVFQDCKRDKPPQVDTLVLSKVADIEEINEDDCSIILHSPCTFDHTRDVVIQGQTYGINHSEADQVWLDRVDGITKGAEVRQDRVYSTDQEIMQQFQDAWSERWNKVRHVEPSQWEQICAFNTSRFHALEWQFEPWNAEALHQVISHKKRTAATGPDGVSRQDLMQIPLAGLQSFADLFNQLENGSINWPLQLVQGFVTSLNKQRGDGGIDSYRPLTVYPLLTRAWSSHRARSALKTLEKYLPSGIRGGVPQRQAKASWFHLAQILEFSFAHQQPLQGIMVDIRRAFNALPRYPIMQALVCLGFPAQIIRPWAKFLVQQQRRFRVRQSVSSPVQSCVGFPEGCALSVFAMVVADWMLDQWLDVQTRGIHDLHAFVDDWHIMVKSSRHIQTVWASLMNFANALDLEIDPAKSFLWAASSTDRAFLRSGPLKLVLAARDLGAHQNFCLRRGNRSLVARLQDMPALWIKLRACLSPYKTKIQALVQAAWPRALYGISVVALGDNHFKALRTGAVNGLRCNRIGDNPAAHLASATLMADPEAWAIIQTLREVREVGGVDSLISSLRLIGVDPSFPNNGPAKILVERLQRLGWVHVHDSVFQDRFGRFDVLSIHWDALMVRCK